MGFPNIDKMMGWLIIPFTVSFMVAMFCWFYVSKFDMMPLWNMATKTALVGAFMTQLAIIPAGWSAALTFFGKKREVVWEDGLSPMPNIAHLTTSTFHFSILYGLILIKDNELSTDQEHDQHRNIDDRRASFGYRASVTPTQMTTLQLLTWFLTGWRSGSPHLWLSNFGFRVMLVCAFISLTQGAALKVEKVVTNTTNEYLGFLSSLGKQLLGPRLTQSAKVATRNTEQPRKQINTTEQLWEGRRPLVPRKEFFAPKPNSKEQLFIELEGDPRKYLLYQEASLGKIHAVWVNESLCATVPPERKIGFITKYPPTNTLNMGDLVDYVKKSEQLTEKEKRFIADNQLKTLGETTSWHTLRKEWYKVDATNYMFIATGPSKEQASEEIPGGIVCF